MKLCILPRSDGSIILEQNVRVTPLSMKGFESHSFHQNRRSTRRQSGRAADGSANTSTVSRTGLSRCESSRMLSVSRSAFCVLALSISSCLC